MKKSWIMLAFVMLCGILKAQEFRIGGGYAYLWSGTWDKAIQTYNFSRPFNDGVQPVLMHGGNLQAAYLFSSAGNIQHGVNLSYAYFRSASDDGNQNNILNFHLINPGYILHLENMAKPSGFYGEARISAALGGMFRNFNGEGFGYDSTRVIAPGIGGEISVAAGYQIHLGGGLHISPYITGGFSPFYAPATEALINQTTGLVSDSDLTGIFTAKAGLAIHFRKE